MKYDKQIEVNRLIDYIKENTEGDSWVVLTTRNVADIMGWAQTFTNTMLSHLKEQSCIEYKEYEGPGRGGKKPFEFRIKANQVVEPIKPKEPKKSVESNSEPMSKEYRNLTESKLDEAISILQANHICRSDREDIIRVLNAFHSKICDKNNPKSSISDLLIMNEEKVEMILTMLISMELIEETKTEPEEKVEYSNLGSEGNRLTKAEEKQVKDALEKIWSEVTEEEVKSEPETLPQIEEVKSDNTDLINNINGFLTMQQDFVSYLKGALDSIDGTDSKQEIEKLSNQLAGCNTIVDKYISNEKVLNDTISNLKEELRLERKIVSAHREKTDNIILNMQQRLEVVIAEVMNEVSAYSKIPAWQRDAVTNARMQNAIVNALNAAIGDILVYNKTSGKES